MIPSNQILVKSASFVPMEETWMMVDALYGGTQTMRAAGPIYLPKAEAETPQDYANRLKHSVLANFYKQAVDTTTDMVYNNGIEVTNSTPTLDAFLDDVNAKGDDLETFMRDATTKASHYGISYIITDFSRNANDPITEYDRPYWCLVEAPNMIALESQMVRGVETITHIRFQEITTRSYLDTSGLQGASSMNYGSTQVSQVRSYWLDLSEPDNPRVYFEIYRRINGDWQLVSQGYQQGVSRIPIVPLYGKKTNFYIGQPMYIDVAELNVRYWQSYSDQANLLHYARFPIMFGTGIEDVDQTGKPKEILIGANTVLRTNNPDADLKFVEHTGKAVDSGWQDIDRLEDLMTVFGPSLAVNAGGNGSTATEWVLRASALNSNLTSIAESSENALNHLMGFTVPYLNEVSMPEFSIDPKVLNINDPKTPSAPATDTVNTVADSGTPTIRAAASAN